MRSPGSLYKNERTRSHSESAHNSFTLWVNTQLAKRSDITAIDGIVNGLSNGIKLIQLLVTLQPAYAK